MKYWILEDEALAAQRLQDKIQKKRPAWECLGVLASLKAARPVLSNHNADFLLVDIHLGDGHSIDLLQELEIQSPLIFTTAYDQYALEAFKLNSLDYLLKPVQDDELERALQKLEQSKNSLSQADWSKLMADIKPSYKERFLVSSGHKLKSINSGEIAFFHASGKHCFLHDLKGEEYLIDFKLKDLVQKLNPSLFFQINRQFIVGIKAISELQPYSKSRLKINCQPPLPEEGIVSVERAGKFKAWLEGEL